jgi:hypothetical protein
VVIVLLAVLAAVAGTSGAAPQRTVPCNEAIDTTVFPYRAAGYRLVLGVVSAPPAYLWQVVSTGDDDWPYWRKQGLIVRAGSRPVTVSVPAAWRARAAIAWGYGGKGEPFSSVRLATCGSGSSKGNAYSGGFYLRARSACVPLVFRVGDRTATVRFGLDRRCPP